MSDARKRIPPGAPITDNRPRRRTERAQAMLNATRSFDARTIVRAAILCVCVAICGAAHAEDAPPLASSSLLDHGFSGLYNLDFSGAQKDFFDLAGTSSRRMRLARPARRCRPGVLRVPSLGSVGGAVLRKRRPPLPPGRSRAPDPASEANNSKTRSDGRKTWRMHGSPKTRRTAVTIDSRALNLVSSGLTGRLCSFDRRRETFASLRLHEIGV